MKFLTLLFTFLIAFSFSMKAQDILLDEVVNDTSLFDSTPDKNVVYTHFGLLFRTESGSTFNGTIIPGKSTTSKIGFGYLRMLHTKFGVGAEAEYSGEKYIIDQDVVDLETIQLNYVNITPNVRFIPKAYDDKKGLFIQAGGYFGFLVGSKQSQEFMVNQTNINAMGTDIEVVTKRLNFVESTQYGIQFRLGYGKVALMSRIRLSDQFNANLFYSEMPNILVGIELGF
jgi:hypothetical protein